MARSSLFKFSLNRDAERLKCGQILQPITPNMTPIAPYRVRVSEMILEVTFVGTVVCIYVI